MARRIILCDGAESARLWARIGADDDEDLLWVPREEETRARPPGFRSLPGGLSADAIARLEARPEGVRLLSLASGPGPNVGERVRILGVPGSRGGDEQELSGAVRKRRDDRIEVDLDVPYDLRGWGGAPVLEDRTGAVVGMLQAHFPSGSTSRVIVSPIGKVRESLRRH